MKWVRYISVFFFCVFLALIAKNKLDGNPVNLTCVGSFSAEIRHDGSLIKHVSDITISFFNNHKIFMVINGSVTQGNKRFHMSRELWYSWKPIDLSKGIIHVSLLEMQRSSTDTIEGDDVNYYLLGAERNGRVVRLWYPLDNILLIGNAFSPVLSCSILI